LFDLLDGYNIHVIAPHRLLTNMQVSVFDEVVKAHNYYRSYYHNFTHFLATKGKNYNQRPLWKILKAFFLDNLDGKMTLIDYYGMVEDNKDIAYVIFCGNNWSIVFY
jgi:hypothetical protein